MVFRVSFRQRWTPETPDHQINNQGVERIMSGMIQRKSDVSIH